MDTTLPRYKQVISRGLPWVSLAVGIVSAFMMDRGPKRAFLVTGAALGCWLSLTIVVWMRPKLEQRQSLLWRSAHFSTLMLTQSAIQLSFFFGLPFYWKAWGGTPEQAVFIGVISVAAAASLWDPLTEWLFQHPGWAPVLPGLATFCALNAVLPGVGLSNSQSLWLAALFTAVVLPMAAILRPVSVANGDPITPQKRRRTVVWTLVFALVFPAGLWLGGARVVPAAPLALLEADIGTHQRGRWVADPIERLERRPSALMCATSIWAPLGVKERLYHVWRQDGDVRDRIELSISGGREEGFRTWSRKRNFGAHPEGTWTCSVETGLGQLLGRREIIVGAEAAR